MCHFTHAILRAPGRSLVRGITSNPQLGKPNYKLALEQHNAYAHALASCGLTVTMLPTTEAFPDSCFIEDPALVTPEFAIITRPGADSRAGEAEGATTALAPFYPPENLLRIEAPGTLDGGDVMIVGRTFYVGLGSRTNAPGVAQLASLVQARGWRVFTLPLREVLHLKTGVAYLGRNTLLTAGEFCDSPLLANFRRLRVPDEEAYAANSLRINERVLTPAGYPQTQQLLEEAGFSTLLCEMSEFRKLDGGLSCLSLRW